MTAEKIATIAFEFVSLAIASTILAAATFFTYAQLSFNLPSEQGITES